MKLKLSHRTVNLALVVLLILVMCTTAGFQLRVGSAHVPIALADVVLALALVGAALSVLARRLRGITVPPVQTFAFVAAALIALLRTQPLGFEAAKEPLQLVEYFLVGYFVFANIAETSDLKLFLAAFAVATAGVVAWGAVHYFTADSPFRVRGTYDNRNLLGAFLAIALPMLYGLALHVRGWRWRILLLAVVAAGLLVNLSGGALFVTLAVLALLSALRGQRALIAYGVGLAAALIFSHTILPRRHHADAVFSSVALKVDDNFLLGDQAMAARARELLHPTHQIKAGHGDELMLPGPRPLDARRLLRLLSDRRGPVDAELYAEVERTIHTSVSADQLASYPLDGPQLAVRYLRWNAGIGCARSLLDKPADALFGRGIVPYHATLKTFMTERLQYRTDEPEVYNIAAPEPFTHNLWLKTLVTTGLFGFLALGWLVGSFLHRAARLYREARSELALGVALGVLGGILGFALAGLFTETIVRGLGLPFVFLLATIPITERIVRGEGRSAIEQLTRYD